MAEVDGVGLQHPQTGPQPPPVRLPPGLLQQSREAPLPGEAAHQGHIVLHSQHPQGLHGLGGLHQGGVRLGERGAGPSGEGHVYPHAHHVALKIPQLGVDEGIPGPLLVGHVVQLV